MPHMCLMDDWAREGGGEWEVGGRAEGRSGVGGRRRGGSEGCFWGLALCPSLAFENWSTTVKMKPDLVPLPFPSAAVSAIHIWRFDRSQRFECMFNVQSKTLLHLFLLCSGFMNAGQGPRWQRPAPPEYKAKYMGRPGLSDPNAEVWGGAREGKGGL